MRERLHEHRYLMFQHGVTVREIAETEGVDERQIYLKVVRGIKQSIPNDNMLVEENP